MKPSGVITLLTDFGLDDPFVGVMKGVIVSRFPDAKIFDLSHAVPPQQIELAALWLELSIPWFPAGTVHVVVVDPKVGSERAAVAYRAGDHLFVAPENGVCDRALARAGDVEARRLEPAELTDRAPSATFHGRDVFAPAAAELASGRRSFEELGRPHAFQPILVSPRANADSDGVSGEVVWVDRFGNLVTNVEARTLSELGSAAVVVRDRRCRMVETYASAAPGELIALVNSFDRLEIAVREGSAAELLGVTRGAPVRVTALRAP